MDSTIEIGTENNRVRPDKRFPNPTFKFPTKQVQLHVKIGHV